MMNAYETYRPLIDWLSYRSYEWNRINSPNIPVEVFIKYFPNGEEFEEIYQENLKRIEEKGAWGHVNVSH